MATVQMPEKLLKDNSHRAREGGPVRTTRETKPLTSGKMRSKPLAMKFAEVFFEGSLKDAISYMINDVAIPQVKNAIIKGIEVIFYGGVNGSSSRGPSNYTNYNSYSSYYVSRDGTRRPNGSNTARNVRESQGDMNKIKKSFDPRLIVVEDRGEAQRVLAELKADCDEFGQVGVDRLFELVNITSDWTSTKYGWVRGDLDDAKVKSCGDGWWFDLPDPIVID